MGDRAPRSPVVCAARCSREYIFSRDITRTSCCHLGRCVPHITRFGRRVRLSHNIHTHTRLPYTLGRWFLRRRASLRGVTHLSHLQPHTHNQPECCVRRVRKVAALRFCFRFGFGFAQRNTTTARILLSRG